MLLHALSFALLASPVICYDQLLGFNAKVEHETRTLDEIYKAALEEDLSKYHDGRLDQQLAAGKIEHAFKDDSAAWYGVYMISWAGAWNTKKLPGIKAPQEWDDWLRPEFKDKLALTYPNDDDAVLFAYYLVLQQYGISWFDKLIAHRPRWVRGTQTRNILTSQENSTSAAYFAGSGRFVNTDTLSFSRPTKGKFVSWPQTAAILKDAPHPEGAKLLHNFLLSREQQEGAGKWSVRRDVATPPGLTNLWDETATSPAEFARFMKDRALVERLRLYFESRIGTPQGESPFGDDIRPA